jgi:threonine synthase
MDQSPRSALSHLDCPECGQHFDADSLQTYCQDCLSPLFARYDLDMLRADLTAAEIKERPAGIWRWAELLPVRERANRITLGEGDTPLLHAQRLGDQLGLKHLYIKDEGLNPTGSFKARGLVMAVARGIELGVQAFVIPTAGNAGGALAAYAISTGRQAFVYMPEDAPRINKVEVQITGAELRLVSGLISDAAQQAAAGAAKHGWFDVSTFKEPYRVEGKKTMGLELAEAFGWDLPEVIIYPTGGGTGLVGMWKAFQELQALEWIGDRLPRMVTVQADGCAPIVRAFEAGALRAEFWENAETIASGLRVPGVFADRFILQTLSASHGTALAVSDPAILEMQGRIGRLEGIFAAPEGAAAAAGLQQLVQDGWINPAERVVLFNTGQGLKYV